jgi:hypothetical protein
VCRLKEALACRTVSGPTPVEARQPSLIKPDAARTIRHRPEHSPVQDSENNEGQAGNQKQQIGFADVTQPEEEPGHAERCQSKQ